MSERIVLLGYDGDALELEPMDAECLLNGKSIRVSFSLWGGDLADATVCYPHKRLLGEVMENATPKQWRDAMATIRRLCPSSRPVTIAA